MQRHNMIENGLMDFDQKAGGEGVAFRGGKAAQFTDIVAFGHVGEIPQHRRTEALEVDPANPEVPEEVIAFNVAQDHGITRLGGIFLELEQRGPTGSAGDLQEVIHGPLQLRGQPFSNPGIDLVLDTSSDGDHEFFQGRPGRKDNLPGA